MRTPVLAAALSLVAPPASPHFLSAQSPSALDSSSIVVTSGSGEVTLSPDRAVIRLAVETRAPTAAEASASNGTRTRHLVDSLTAVHLLAESIQVVGVAVSANENFERGELINYEASAVVRITVRDLDRLGRILDVAFAAGATSLSQIEFESDRATAARRDALAKAFAEAKANAEALARAAAVSLGPLLRVSTEPEASPFRGYQLQAVTVSRGTSISPEDIVVHAGVVTTWRLVKANR